MSFPEINAYIQNQFGSGESAAEVFTANTTNYQPYLTIPAERLVELCQFLRDDEQLFFDLLACITVIDNGADADTMDIFYNLTSIPFEHNLMLKVTVSRRTGESELPALPSVAHIWRTADWHEREAFDLVGIRFTGHPDLRRILLPKDWVGHPLRADYKEEEQYHGIKTK